MRRLERREFQVEGTANSKNVRKGKEWFESEIVEGMGQIIMTSCRSWKGVWVLF